MNLYKIGEKAPSIFDNLKSANDWLSTEVAAYFLSISANALRIMAHRGQIILIPFDFSVLRPT